MSVSFDDQYVAFSTIDHFHQPTRNVTRLETKLVAENAALSDSVSKDLRLERKSGKVSVDVHVKAKIRFKVGIWKSSDRTVRILCSPVIMHLSSSKNFDAKECDIDI